MREVLSLAKRRRRCVLALLDAGANVDAVRADGMRPINRALKLSNHTAKRAGILAGGRLARGATYNIYIAAVNGDHDYVKKELLRDPALANFEHSADPSLPEKGAPLGEALWIAVYQKQPEMAKLLLKHGANPNTAPESSGSALLQARGVTTILRRYKCS